MHVAMVTAGGAGMFCGSCMLDNAWARALRNAGAEITLIPLYTPIRVDEEDLSSKRVFFGGINLYLEGRFRFWRKIPRAWTRWLDHPAIIRWATSRAVSRDARELGEMAVAMLDGEHGPHARAGEELAQFLGELRPDVVCFSNALLSGPLRAIQQHYRGPIYCVLQGDDVFLQMLVPPWQNQVIERVSTRAADFDGYLAHSAYYRDFMSGLLNLDLDKFSLLPLAIDTTLQPGAPRSQPRRPPTIGYFARICHEKGFHLFLEAAALAASRHPEWRFLAGGWLGHEHATYFQTHLAQWSEVLRDRFEYVGSPSTHEEKTALFERFDLLSVPTVYREPKGLYVLEAQANGVPVVQPDHGAFPEMMSTARGGLTVTPNNPEALVAGWEEVLLSDERYAALSRRGYEDVRQFHSLETLAARSLELWNRAIGERMSANGPGRN